MAAPKKSTARRGGKRNRTAAAELNRFNVFLAVLFATLSFVFLLMAIWKYWL